MYNKKKSLIIILAVSFMALVIAGCGTASDDGGTKNSGQYSQTQDSTAENTQQSSQTQNSVNLKKFTREELGKFDGQNGSRAYVAVEGKVYDVTGVEAWKNGGHQGFKAGNDLTEAIKASPHGLSALENVPEVGELVE